MRSTGKVTNNNSLYYMNRTYNSLMKVSSQIALEQQVVNLEDDPMSANIGIRMLNVISRSEQYNRNIKTGVGQLRLTEGYLGSCKTILDEAKTLVTTSANDPSATLATRATTATQINSILQQLVTAGNASDGTRYAFGGTHTKMPPFSIVNSRYVNYLGNDKALNIAVDNGTVMRINTTGTDAYGNMETTIPSRDMNPDINLSTDHSTRLSDLNGGAGIPKGKITVYYSAYPEGLEVDLSGCDTLEDVKDTIEKQTLEASRNLDPHDDTWLNGRNLDWRDLQDRYVKVTMNPEHNGISLQEYDLGEPLPEPTVYERKHYLDYSGIVNADVDYRQGGKGLGSALGTTGETPVYDKRDYIYRKDGTNFNSQLRVDDYAGNNVATALGIKGSAPKYDPANPDPVLDGCLHGSDLNPALSDRTLLSDLEGYNDSVYSFTNGAKPESFVVKEVSQDANNRFNDWNLNGLAKGRNTGANGELYVYAVNNGTATSPDISVEVYTCPRDKARASDLVATGKYTESQAGGTVLLTEANNSGLSGTVGVILPTNVGTASVDLRVDFGETLQGSVHVPAFIEEQHPDGKPMDSLGIASGWNIRGLDKPPADKHDENHNASTDLEGDVAVNYRYDAASNSFIVELSRPSYSDQPAKVIATGSIYLGDNNVDAGPPPTIGNAVSGRVEFIGEPGFEGVKGSVYIELPGNCAFAANGAGWGVGAANATTTTYRLTEDVDGGANAVAGTLVLGGAMELQSNFTASADFTLKENTIFHKGQVFNNPITLFNGITIPAGEPLAEDVLVPHGTRLVAGTVIQSGTVLTAGQRISGGPLVAGTVIPRGSYYEGGPGFPSDGMGMTANVMSPYTGNSVTAQQIPMGYDLRATFATVEDFNRAVEEAGVHVSAKVGVDGKSLEFASTLAGAYLTVSEDTDCYEQMGDVHQQLTDLDLNGMIKGLNSDKNGNVYTEVIFYPPDPVHPEDKVRLVNKDGDIVEVEPGYYVRVYSDPDQMKVPYEDRDNTTLVAEGFVPSPEWNTDYLDGTDLNPENALIPTAPLSTMGFMNNLILEERNDSGVSGTVNLDYYGGRDETSVPPGAPNAGFAMVPSEANAAILEPKFDYWNNAEITVFPGGLRPEGSRHTTIQEWDLYDITPGVTADYTGTVHGVITGNAASAAVPGAGGMGVDIRLYRDQSNTVMTAKNDPSEALVDGKVVLYEVDRHGNWALDAEGRRIVAGRMAVARSELLDGQSDSFKLTTGANRNYGQEREENVFSTMNDILDALNANDAEKLHDLLGTLQKDIDRILLARGDVGTKTQRLNMLSERHADDVVRFTGILTSRVGMDDQALAMSAMNYQAAMNAHQAAMQVSSQIMNISLLQYI